MKITEFCLENRTTTLVLTVVMIVAGIGSYNNMGRLEDPEFTIKDALVITQYPGATAEEVEDLGSFNQSGGRDGGICIG